LGHLPDSIQLFGSELSSRQEGLEYAASRGLGVVIMEPLRGGRLAEQIPEKVQAIWDSSQEKRSPAEWALRWVWNHPQVSTALSGMNSMDQLKENLKIADDGRAHSLSSKDLALIDRVTETYQKMFPIDCTACSYCLPCPQGVNIPIISGCIMTIIYLRTRRSTSSFIIR